MYFIRSTDRPIVGKTLGIISSASVILLNTSLDCQRYNCIHSYEHIDKFYFNNTFFTVMKYKL